MAAQAARIWVLTHLGEARFNDEDKTVTVKVLQPGWSKNGNYYSKDVAVSLADKLRESTKSFCDHRQDEQTKKFGRSLRDWTATVQETRVNDGIPHATLRMTANPETQWLYEEAKQHPHEVGISIDAQAKVTENGEAEGRKGRIVEEILSARCDFVASPSAGGHVTQVTQAQGDTTYAALVEGDIVEMEHGGNTEEQAMKPMAMTMMDMQKMRADREKGRKADDTLWDVWSVFKKVMANIHDPENPASDADKKAAFDQALTDIREELGKIDWKAMAAMHSTLVASSGDSDLDGDVLWECLMDWETIQGLDDFWMMLLVEGKFDQASLDNEDFTEIRYRVRDPGDFDQATFRRKEVTPGVVFVMGKLTGETTMTLQSVRFLKEKFDTAMAKKWVKDHLKESAVAEALAFTDDSWTAVDKANLPAGDFLIVGDPEKKDTWHLPYKAGNTVYKGALRAISVIVESGQFRGKAIDFTIPQAVRDKVEALLKAAKIGEYAEGTNTTQKGDSTMTPDEIKAMITEALTPVMTQLTTMAEGVQAQAQIVDRLNVTAQAATQRAHLQEMAKTAGLPVQYVTEAFTRQLMSLPNDAAITEAIEDRKQLVFRTSGRPVDGGITRPVEMPEIYEATLPKTEETRLALFN
jgi:hypothetical protein